MEISNNSRINKLVRSCTSDVPQDYKINYPAWMRTEMEGFGQQVVDVVEIQSKNVKKPGIIRSIIQPMINTLNKLI